MAEEKIEPEKNKDQDPEPIRSRGAENHKKDEIEDTSESSADGEQSKKTPSNKGSNAASNGSMNAAFNGDTLVDQTAHDLQDMKRVANNAGRVANTVKNVSQAKAGTQQSPAQAQEQINQSKSESETTEAKETKATESSEPAPGSENESSPDQTEPEDTEGENNPPEISDQQTPPINDTGEKPFASGDEEATENHEPEDNSSGSNSGASSSDTSNGINEEASSEGGEDIGDQSDSSTETAGSQGEYPSVANNASSEISPHDSQGDASNAENREETDSAEAGSSDEESEGNADESIESPSDASPMAATEAEPDDQKQLQEDEDNQKEDSSEQQSESKKDEESEEDKDKAESDKESEEQEKKEQAEKDDSANKDKKSASEQGNNLQQKTDANKNGIAAGKSDKPEKADQKIKPSGEEKGFGDKPGLSDKKIPQGGISVGKNAAQDAKELAKAVSGVATGNGAATVKAGMKLGKSSAKKIISAVLVIMILFTGAINVIFSYALPSSVFEVVETYTKDYYKEKYESAVYGSEGNVTWAKFIEGIKIGFEIVGDAGDTFLSWIGGKLGIDNKDHDGQDIETLSGDGVELKVAQIENAEKTTLKNKIEATQKKVDSRAEDIADAITGNEDSIEEAVVDHYMATGEYDEVEAEVCVTPYRLSQEGAAAIMGLYMVQAGGSLEDVRTSSLLKWLGYEEGIGIGNKVEFNVLGVECEVKHWYGTFLPQYLYEQRIQEEVKYKEAQTNFEDYQAAAADLILVADVPEMEEIPIYKTVVEDEDGNQKTVGTATVNIKVQPRELKDIADLMGMWIGDLTKRQEYMISDLSVNMVASGGSGSTGIGNYEWVEGGELIAWTPQHNLNETFIGIPYQCTWYAADRLLQLYRDTNGEYGADLTGLYMGNGGDWSANARKYGFKVDNIAEVGKAACFVPGQTEYHPGDPWAISPTYGHVAIVEKVNPDGSILVSEFWGSVQDGQVHFSTFTKETAAQIDYIDFTVRT